MSSLTVSESLLCGFAPTTRRGPQNIASARFSTPSRGVPGCCAAPIESSSWPAASPAWKFPASRAMRDCVLSLMLDTLDQASGHRRRTCVEAA